MKLWSLVGVVMCCCVTPLFGVEVSHGPWVFNPDKKSVSIGVVTKANSGAGVVYWKKGDSKKHTVYDLVDGRLNDFKANHIINIDGLESGTTYEYSLILADQDQGLHNDAQVLTVKTDSANPQKPFSFKTIGPEESYSVFVTSDLQFPTPRREEILRNLINNSKSQDADFMFLVGDMNNAIWDFEDDVLVGYIDELVRQSRKSEVDKSLVLIRGNHEWRGGQAYLWSQFFDTPSHRTYYSFTLGDVFYIVLDSGEDKLDRTPGHPYTDFNETDQFLLEERRWLEKLVKSPEFKDAKFRVVLVHSSTFGQVDDFMIQNMGRMTKDLLNGTSPEDRIHLLIAGHEHLYARLNAKDDRIVTYMANDENKNTLRVPADDFNYTMVANDGPGYGGVDVTGLLMQVNGDNIEIKAFDESGKVIDKFKIEQDGKCIDLLKDDEMETFTLKRSN